MPAVVLSLASAVDKNDSDASRADRNASRLTIATITGSLLMAPILLGVHLVSHSQLALAQALDSLSDSLGGIALVFALRASARAADEAYPHGYKSAEPIGALVVAVLVGVLALEVFRTALTSSEQPRLDWPVTAVFLGKIAFKSIIVVLASIEQKKRRNPAVDALRIDAASDVLVCSLSVLGVVLARFRWMKLDVVLAVLVAIYIAVSSIRLARENVSLLMGTSAPSERREQLVAIARSVTGVEGVDQLLATFFGTSLHVHVDITVNRALSLIDAHEIGHRVEERLAAERDVARAVVHVGPSTEDRTVCER